MSYKDNCKKKYPMDTSHISGIYQCCRKGACPVPAEGGEDSRGAGNT